MRNIELILSIADAARVALWTGVGPTTDHCNVRWSHYTGILPDDGDWEQAVHVDDQERCRQTKAAAQLEPQPEIELRLRGADGSYRLHRVTFIVAGQRWFGLARELTNPLRENFLAKVSHELRAPTAAVLLWVRVLRDELDVTTRTRALDAIHQGAILQARLIDDLLDLARASVGKLAVELRSVEIVHVLEKAHELVRPLATAKQQHLEVALAPELGRVEGDSGRLVQVVENLLSNAIKFTPAQGHVRLTASRAGREVVVAVQDDGKGIAPEVLPHIFDTFVQSEDAAKAPGLGLGLAIASELVALHGGHIEAHSDGVGKGATFVVRLKATERAATPVPQKTGGARLEDIAVLIVDDDRRVLAALDILLRRAGAEVETARSVAAAWESIERAPPDLIISDIAMPGEDGFVLIRRLRSARQSLAEIPAIALTAHASAADAARVIDAGFDEHLAKPVDLDVIVAAISRLVHREVD